MAVKNKNSVRIDTRLNVLTTAVGEYAQAFGADEACLDSIRKGVYQKQIIEEIQLRYFSEKEFVGLITMKIDWAMHQILVNSENGNEFRIDSSKSVLEQLDAASHEIIRHVEQLKKQCNVTTVRSSFQYREEYRNDPQKHKEAMDFLGHVRGGKRIEEQSTEMFKTYIRFVIDCLKELEIVVEN